MKSIQVLKILCQTNFMVSTIPISILYSLFYNSSLTKIFNEVSDVSDPTYLNRCKDSSSSLIISKSVGETQISDSQESEKILKTNRQTPMMMASSNSFQNNSYFQFH